MVFNITSQTTTVCSRGAGFLHNLVINTPLGSGVIKIYDGVSASGALLATITQPATLLGTNPVSVIYDLPYVNGLTIVTSGANQNLTVVTNGDLN